MPLFKTKTTNVVHQSVMNKENNKGKICGIGDSRFLKKSLRKTYWNLIFSIALVWWACQSCVETLPNIKHGSFCKNGQLMQSLTIFGKGSILNIWHSSQNASVCMLCSGDCLMKETVLIRFYKFSLLTTCHWNVTSLHIN